MLTVGETEVEAGRSVRRLLGMSSVAVMAGRLREQRLWGMRVAERVWAEVQKREGREAQGWRSGMGVSERRHRTPSMVQITRKHPVCFSQKVPSQGFTRQPQNKGTRMVDELLFLLRCHCVASGDPAKPSSLSKEVGAMPIPQSACLGHRTNR